MVAEEFEGQVRGRGVPVGPVAVPERGDGGGWGLVGAGHLLLRVVTDISTSNPYRQIFGACIAASWLSHRASNSRVGQFRGRSDRPRWGWWCEGAVWPERMCT